MTRVLTAAAVVLVALWVIVPFYLLLLAALTAQAAVSDYPKSFLPASLTTAPLAAFADSLGIVPATINSLAVALIAIAVALLAGPPAAYLAARSRGVHGLALLGRVFPISALAVPLAVLLVQFGWYDSVVAVGMVHAAIALPFAVLVASPGFAPGAGTRARATSLGAAAGLTFLISWNEVFAASVLTLQIRTLPAQLFASLATSPLSFKLAGALVLIVPAVVVFLLIRRSLVRVWS
jgi:multiple sugar transport system permease protein